MYLELFRKPQQAIPLLVMSDPEPWLVPFVGFFCVSFAEGYDRVLAIWPNRPGVVLLLLVAAGALGIGAWGWAGMFGGALHLSTRLFGGKPGASETIRAVGYAFFWPGILGAVSGAAVILMGYRGDDPPPAAMVPLLLLQACASLWAVYTVVVSLRAWHGFGWWRAIGSYLTPFVILITVVVVYAIAMGSAS